MNGVYEREFLEMLVTLRAADSRRSSRMTLASASGLTPLSHSRTQIDSDSASSPVFSNFEISRRATARMVIKRSA